MLDTKKDYIKIVGVFMKLSVTFTKKFYSHFMKLRITFTYSCSIKYKKNKETLSLFVLRDSRCNRKKAGRRFVVDVVQKMLIPKIATKDKLQ